MIEIDPVKLHPDSLVPRPSPRFWIQPPMHIVAILAILRDGKDLSEAGVNKLEAYINKLMKQAYPEGP